MLKPFVDPWQVNWTVAFDGEGVLNATSKFEFGRWAAWIVKVYGMVTVHVQYP